MFATKMEDMVRILLQGVKLEGYLQEPKEKKREARGSLSKEIQDHDFDTELDIQLGKIP